MVYLLTMEPTVSFWDCGEFIAISSLLQVGHPPGAPLYQLLSHIFSLMAGSNALAVARWCNSLSAVAAGLTVMFLYWSILLLFHRADDEAIISRPRIAGVIGALCYLFCDTAWFSAVESEVYSLAMFIASVIIWAMLRWYRCHDSRQAQRWIMLIALLLGLGFCVHQITLLTSPTLLLLFIFKIHQHKQEGKPLPTSTYLGKVIPISLIFFVIGITPYLIIPIRAAANPPINQGQASTVENFKAYMARDQYEKAPVYPRLWRHRGNDDLYAAAWNGGDTNLAGNMRYYTSYQLTYMYLRYLMWNFTGRYNDRQGYGSPQNGQFITGVPFLDKMLVGTSARPPKSLHTDAHNVYFLLPLLLGILGVIMLNDRKMFWTVMSLFLMGGFILSIYLNHPCYEPRERDYAYILSFYAFCMFIGIGAAWTAEKIAKGLLRLKIKSDAAVIISCVMLLGVPTLMACQNWDDHNRSGRYIAHDAGANILNSCDKDPRGTLLFCYGDNDTFPLWYLQSVEELRTDITVANVGLIGYRNFLNMMEESIEEGRPIYFTHYAYNQFGKAFSERFQLEGNCYRLMDDPCDSVAIEPFYRHVMSGMGWKPVKDIYVDEVSCRFLEMYWRDIVLLANNLATHDSCQQGVEVLNKTIAEIPLCELQDVQLIHQIGQAYLHNGEKGQADSINTYLLNILEEQMAYFRTMPLSKQRVMPYTLGPREELMRLLKTGI